MLSAEPKKKKIKICKHADSMSIDFVCVCSLSFSMGDITNTNEKFIKIN